MACDEHVAEVVRTNKSASIQSNDPATWLTQMAEIESYAPLMAYLVRSLQSGSDLAKEFWRRTVGDVEQYLDDGVRAGTVKPSRVPRHAPTSWGWPAPEVSCSTYRSTRTRATCAASCCPATSSSRSKSSATP